MRVFLFLAALLYCVKAPAQVVTTINYANSGLSTSLCNVFNISSGATIGGLRHYPVSGGVTFNGTSAVLSTQYKIDATSNIDRGTAYAIEYPFRAGYTYSLALTMQGTKSSTGSFPYASASLMSSLPNINTSQPTACGPVNKSSYSSALSGMVYQVNVNQNTTYTFPNYAPTRDAGYVVITAHQGSESGSVAISKVVITETTTPSPEGYWVGVIPGTGTCPSSSSLITVHMDDEDNDNENSRAGWIGAITSNNNTTFRFCRVDGRQFYPLAATNAVTNHYAVLKLGAQCPNGSTEFNRQFDNEDDNNQNSVISSSGIATDYAAVYSTRQNYGLTRLHFCLFTAGTNTMSGFPALGIDYGVFAASDFSKTLQTTGWVYTDDEDHYPNNENSFGGDGHLDGRRIVTPTGSYDQNTTLHIAKVSCVTPDCGYCGDAICSPYENSSSCGFDCTFCGDGTCGAGEGSWNCSLDCSSCGDFICGPTENYYTCDIDCSSACGNGYCDVNEGTYTCPQDC